MRQTTIVLTKENLLDLSKGGSITKEHKTTGDRISIKFQKDVVSDIKEFATFADKMEATIDEVLTDHVLANFEGEMN